MIIASSGMATGGRVVHHLFAGLPDPRNTVLFVGFQAAGTRGRQLIDGAQHVKIFGQHVPVHAKIEKIDGLSSHADAGEIIRWLRTFPRAPKVTYLVHGEIVAQDALKAAHRQGAGLARRSAVARAEGRRSVMRSDHKPAATEAPPDTRPYLLEQIDDAAVVQLYADGFDKLSLTEKTLVYHLYRAAIAGRDIYYDQRHRHNLGMRRLLEADPHASRGHSGRDAQRDHALHEAVLDQYRPLQQPDRAEVPA